jgi:hypothetical protein
MPFAEGGHAEEHRFFAFIIGLFVGGVLLILHLGADLPPGRAEPVTRSGPSVAGTHQPGRPLNIGSFGSDSTCPTTDDD